MGLECETKLMNFVATVCTCVCVCGGGGGSGFTFDRYTQNKFVHIFNFFK